MSSEQNRRTFLKLSAMGMAAATSEFASAASLLPPSSDITVRVTGGTSRYSTGTPLAWRSSNKTPANTVVLDPQKKYQEMLGFGAAFTDAACYTFNRLAAPARDELFHELFDPSQMGLNVCRTCIGASDYSTEVFSYDEGDPDPDMKRFSIAHDQAYVLAHAATKRANRIRICFCSPRRGVLRDG